MEDWLAFTETFSLYLLQGLPWEAGQRHVQHVFERMWANLRDGVLHFMRFEEGQHTPERILAAQKKLLEYGKIAEKVC